MRKKRNSKFFLLPVFCVLLSACADIRAFSREPDTSAAAVVLMEQESGEVLFCKNADEPMPIASITKIMTGLLAAERCDPDETVTVQPEWLAVEGSSMGLRAGEAYRVEDLLYGLMLASGNDAAVALACHMEGSVSAFADAMNARAAELGMRGTHFRNPHGLTQEGHYSTARDMGILACAAMDNPRFAAVAGSRTAQAEGRTLRNHNRLLWDYPGALGVKTGFTDAAGRTLVSCARREDMTLVCVTLNDPCDWKDHTALLDWGFSAYTVERTGSLSLTVPVISGRKDALALRPGVEATVPVPRAAEREWRYGTPGFLYAPCRPGEAAGRAELYVDGEPVFSCPLVTGEASELDEAQRLSFWEKLRRCWYFACRNGYAPLPVLLN